MARVAGERLPANTEPAKIGAIVLHKRKGIKTQD